LAGCGRKVNAIKKKTTDSRDLYAGLARSSKLPTGQANCKKEHETCPVEGLQPIASIATLPILPYDRKGWSVPCMQYLKTVPGNTA
jgi:hypothetical protein